MKIKMQAVEPDTCDPPGCRYLELWDVDAPAELREHRVAAFERTCPAHATDLPVGLLLWWDGNWKPLDRYVAYQRAWFRRLNHVEWLQRAAALEAWYAARGGRHPTAREWAADGTHPAADPAARGLVGYAADNMPPQIAVFTVDPATTGSLPPPAQARQDGLARAYGWNRADNARKNVAIDLLVAEVPTLDRNLVTWAGAGAGEARALTVRHGGQLTPQQAARARAQHEARFGANLVAVEP